VSTTKSLEMQELGQPVNTETQPESPGDPNCPLCAGLGMTRKGLDTQQCRCAFVKNVKRRLGKDIMNAHPAVYSSPLYEPAKDGGPPLIDLTTENLFIRARWEDFLPHFKLAATNLLSRTGFQWYFQLVTDERIKSVFVGNESYSSRARKQRDDVASFNSLGDLLGGDFDLVIIQLGYLGYKNVAAPGALKEALLIRQAANKPTWIVDPNQNEGRFQPGHLAYSQDLAEYLALRYMELELKIDREVPLPARVEIGYQGAHLSVGNEEGLILDDADNPRPTPQRMKIPKGPAVDVYLPRDLDNDPVLGTGSASKKYTRKYRGGGQ
jgi:hypothetical protein